MSVIEKRRDTENEKWEIQKMLKNSFSKYSIYTFKGKLWNKMYLHAEYFESHAFYSIVILRCKRWILILWL